MAIRNAEASLRMEGLAPSEDVLRECRRVLDGEISHEDYIANVKRKYMRMSEAEYGELYSCSIGNSDRNLRSDRGNEYY
ncbi:MAG: antitoxin VbhA family protein [Clostridiales bacterium]|jgi:hypothetical protein|nr:antitoxin VbhA family protein [Clostridiales bacterium]